ncbi:hypothetical protein AVEN_216623-1 [Araneus ventricosus]|uniref:Uncharacterized protein n=1 Tax=Araneus ventricosus TaxID=182803 RepID=A0A4Y2DX17_ARAVE|nr:hypothetical protein AVEN_216623-1 [Araneus ventricosus]
MRSTISKGTKTKEVGKFRITKVLASYVWTLRNSDVTARTNETVNPLKTMNKNRLQYSKFSEVQSTGTINATEETHFLQPEVISDARSNEALDNILKANCQISGNEVFSLKTESDVTQKFLEDTDFGSEPEQENERSFREVNNAIIVEEELIPDYEIPVSAESVQYEFFRNGNNKLKSFGFSE